MRSGAVREQSMPTEPRWGMQTSSRFALGCCLSRSDPVDVLRSLSRRALEPLKPVHNGHTRAGNSRLRLGQCGVPRRSRWWIGNPWPSETGASFRKAVGSPPAVLQRPWKPPTGAQALGRTREAHVKTGEALGARLASAWKPSEGLGGPLVKVPESRWNNILKALGISRKAIQEGLDGKPCASTNLWKCGL